jgi:hypothetical protein
MGVGRVNMATLLEGSYEPVCRPHPQLGSEARQEQRIRCGNSPLGRDAQPHKGTGVQGRDWQDP